MCTPESIVEELLPERGELLRRRRMGSFTETDRARLAVLDAEIERWEAVLAETARSAHHERMADAEALLDELMALGEER